MFSSPENSYLKIISFQVRCCVFLLHQVKEGKGEDGDGGNGRQALAVWRPDWRDMSVIVIRRRCQG